MDLQVIIDRGRGGPTIYFEDTVDVSSQVIEEFNKDTRNPDSGSERGGVTMKPVTIWCAGIISAVLTQVATAAEPFKVAIIDQQAVIERSISGKRALEEMKTYSTTRQKIIEADDQELKELEKAGQDPNMSEETKRRNRNSSARNLRRISGASRNSTARSRKSSGVWSPNTPKKSTRRRRLSLKEKAIPPSSTRETMRR